MDYRYAGIVTKVIDGDTLQIDIDLGFNIVRRGMKIRLNRINSAEKGTPDGDTARMALRALVEGRPCVLQTLKDRTEKYGRYLGEVTPIGETNISDEMVALGHAKYWDGHGTRPTTCLPPTA